MFSSSVLRGSGRKVQSAHSMWQTHVRRSFYTGGVWEVGRAMGSSPTWEQTCDFGVVRVPRSHRLSSFPLWAAAGQKILFFKASFLLLGTSSCWWKHPGQDGQLCTCI